MNEAQTHSVNLSYTKRNCEESVHKLLFKDEKQKLDMKKSFRLEADRQKQKGKTVNLAQLWRSNNPRFPSLSIIWEKKRKMWLLNLLFEMFQINEWMNSSAIKIQFPLGNEGELTSNSIAVKLKSPIFSSSQINSVYVCRLYIQLFYFSDCSLQHTNHSVMVKHSQKIDSPIFVCLSSYLKSGSLTVTMPTSISFGLKSTERTW